VATEPVVETDTRAVTVLPRHARPAAAATPSAPDHLAAIDGLRAVAVLTVLAYHVVPVLPALRAHAIDVSVHLNIGVQIFFVLSGFLIYSPFVRSHLAGAPGPGLRSYARRRILRIYPAYLLAFAVLWATGVIAAGTPGEVLAHLSLTHTYVAGTGDVGLGQSWSLVVEVSFYLFVPLWALTVRAAARRLLPTARWRAELAGAAALIPLGLAASWLSFYHRVPAAMTVLPPALTALGCGMVLAVVQAARRDRPGVDRALRRLPRAGWWWLAALAAFAVETTRPFDLIWATPDQRMWQAAWQPLVSVLLVAPIVLLAGRTGLVGRFATWAPIAWVGLVSYGVYLWQTAAIQPVPDAPAASRSATDLAMAAGVAVAAVVLGSLSYVLVERPLLRRTSGRRARDVAVTAP
jgi:peptidoglycan/LPS O-acetylase OafA/YrhL